MPKRTLSSVFRVSRFQPRVMSMYPGFFTLGVTAHHVGGQGEPFELWGLEIFISMSRRKLAELVTPHPKVERVCGPVSLARHCGRDCTRGLAPRHRCHLDPCFFGPV